jgi:hypothetical protein
MSPLPKGKIIASEYANASGGTFVAEGDHRIDPTEAELAQQRERNLISVADLERLVGPEVLRWLQEKGVLGTPFMSKGRSRFFEHSGWRHQTTVSFRRDQCEAAFDEVRRIAAALPERGTLVP